ncbi:tyrosine-type recombinase/integrase [Aeoliella mucimassa]|uniref:Phage integrase family protein n=1 Tax=Aeoliella mucimassa TaxID=2527972 RepID=A0A518AM27_9BACT|nr:site-specific integrase [Aeoliella mucimassa]QDU55774.1 Phage integrase family protein [Aeoliella mucimassa]
MASLIKTTSKRTGKPRYSVQVNIGERNRPTFPLGQLTKKQAEAAKGHIENLLSTKRSGSILDGPTADWLARIDNSLRDRLAKYELCAPRVATKPQTAVPKLGAFIDGYISKRSEELKPRTIINLKVARGHLVEFFSVDRDLDSITPGDADDFRRSLIAKGLEENTVRRTCGRAKQFFRDAVRRRVIDESPFADMKATSVTANRKRDYFVTSEEADAMLEACPDTQWKLIIALSRYGGLRCPSEHLALTWGDVDWKRKRIRVRSPKTAHHDGHEERIMPLFPQLQPYLEAAWQELIDSEDFTPEAQPTSELPVITRYRDSNSNLRTQLLRIIKRAGLVAWPKLFQNMRATRATELAKEHPGHVAATWLGHSTKVADKHTIGR